MPEVILTTEQVRIVNQANGRVIVRDANGTILGRIQPEITPELIQELKRRAATPGPRYTGTQVQARLRALQEEWDRMGGFNLEYMQDFLKRLNDAEPGHMPPHGIAG